MFPGAIFGRTTSPGRIGTFLSFQPVRSRISAASYLERWTFISTNRRVSAICERFSRYVCAISPAYRARRLYMTQKSWFKKCARRQCIASFEKKKCDWSICNSRLVPRCALNFVFSINFRPLFPELYIVVLLAEYSNRINPITQL